MTPEQERAEARKALEAATSGKWEVLLGSDDDTDNVIVYRTGDTVAKELLRVDAHFIANTQTWLRNSLDREEQLINERDMYKLWLEKNQSELLKSDTAHAQLILELDHADAIAENWRREAFRKYPTPDAYEAACKALQKHKTENEWLNKALEAECNQHENLLEQTNQLIAENERLKEEIKRLKEVQKNNG